MYQQLTIVGNLGGDPELRYTPQGTPVANFSVAVNETWTTDGEKQERVTWFRVTVWRRMAEVCSQYLSKGRQVMVVGTLRSENGNPRIWEDNSGNARASFEVTAQTVKFLGARGDSAPVSVPQEEEEIPF